MLTIYLTLMICTALPVVALQTGMGADFLAWLVFGLVVMKAMLLVDHFMEMRKAPRGWRLAAQAWAPVVVAVISGFRTWG
ncbi:hypothetical protein D777_01458 [Marinobacter nitratireducens]|uniref:Uncharacterized protein n=1 Tax=Marinobacter nitratireducens TaxID=1137280 RepID=A0A072N3F6_9GAMM|nr:cytochrome C oxidase subunit IV family protein [Marinobacter nitratireducens]KEF31772.1 hypothetical protein D777_01458 [Marinobacter nitratireducens]